MTTQTLEEELDGWFSKFIRLLYADWKGEIKCYTCNTRGHWKDFDCGHFIRRGVKELRYEEDNARPQCRLCNRHLGGKYDVFEEELRDEIGDLAVDEMLLKKYQVFILSDEWYKERIIYFKGAVNKLLSKV